MPLLISDANIFIDFDEGGILERLFDLEVTIAVPDLLFEDELREQYAHLLDLGLQMIELDAAAILRVVELGTRYRRPSRMDLAALAAAEQQGCPLVTGDRGLREAAETEGVEVHGTLWLCERLFRGGQLEAAALHTAYRRMRLAGRRLPWSKVEAQLAEFAKAESGG